jgi:hypothetical protein
MTDPLAKLFGSSARVKLLRLFLFHPRAAFTAPEAAVRARVTERLARSELALYQRSKLIKRNRRRGIGASYSLNADFEYRAVLQSLLLNAPIRAEEILARLRSVGGIKFIAIAGIFMGEWAEERLDLLLVGDRVKERRVRERINRLESEIGREVRYALLPSLEFYYRLNMSDKLVRDVLDYPHRILLDRLQTGLK